MKAYVWMFVLAGVVGLAVGGGDDDVNRDGMKRFIAKTDSIRKVIALSTDSITGNRSMRSVARGISGYDANLRYPYIRRLRDNPDLSGTITVKFAIDEFGKVVSATLVKSTMNDTTFEKATVDRIKKCNFEEIDKPGDTTVVIYPFYFAQ